MVASLIVHDALSVQAAGVLIRPATQTDVDDIAVIERAVFNDPWSRRSFADLVDRTEVVFLVAVDGSAAVGYAVVLLAADQAELANLAVAPLLQRHQLGSRLLREALGEAAARGGKEMFLEVRESNQAAAKLYEAAGFSPIGRRVRYYARPIEDAIVMKRSIDAVPR